MSVVSVRVPVYGHEHGGEWTEVDVCVYVKGDTVFTCLAMYS